MHEPIPPAPTRAEAEAAGLGTHPGARRPDRRRTVSSGGLDIAVWEWGDPDDPPVLLAHGGFDFAGTFDTLAPRVADAGFRVVSWDQRGCGDSAHAHLYSWDADLRDAAAVLDSIGPRALPVVGHSKGGAQMLQLADALPHRVSHLVNLDGLPSRRSWPDVPDHHRTRMLNGELGAWLDHRRRAGTKVRRPGTVDELAERRGRMNPRMDPAWLRYLVPIGAYAPENLFADVHINPEDALKAASVLGARVAIAHHWGTYNLGAVKPAEARARFLAARASGVTPRVLDIGETISLK